MVTIQSVKKRGMQPQPEYSGMVRGFMDNGYWKKKGEMYHWKLDTHSEVQNSQNCPDLVWQYHYAHPRRQFHFKKHKQRRLQHFIVPVYIRESFLSCSISVQECFLLRGLPDTDTNLISVLCWNTVIHWNLQELWIMASVGCGGICT